MYKGSYSNYVQVVIRTKSGELVDRLSPWAVYVVQPPRVEGFTYKQRFWNPPFHEVRHTMAYLKGYVYKT